MLAIHFILQQFVCAGFHFRFVSYFEPANIEFVILIFVDSFSFRRNVVERIVIVLS